MKKTFIFIFVLIISTVIFSNYKIEKHLLIVKNTYNAQNILDQSNIILTQENINIVDEPEEEYTVDTQEENDLNPLDEEHIDGENNESIQEDSLATQIPWQEDSPATQIPGIEEEIETIELPTSPPVYETNEMLSDNEVVVHNFLELKNALSIDNGIDTVYFGNNIIMQSTGILINSKKTQVTIHGINPLDSSQTEPYTLTDFSGSAQTQAIYANGANQSLTSIHIKNLNIIGKNYYGPISIFDAVGTEKIVVTYENVDYSGPALGYHRKGTCHFINVKGKIHGGNGGSPAHEFLESKNVFFSGANEIEILTNDLSVFWMPLGGLFEIAENSSVKVISPNTSTTYGLFYADAYAIALKIGVNSIFDIKASATITPAGMTFSSINLQKDSTFKIETTGKTVTTGFKTSTNNFTLHENAKFIFEGIGGTGSMVQQRGNIILGENTVFHIIGKGNYNSILDAYGFSLIASNPDSVVLSSINSRAIVATATATNLNLNAEQINFWTTVTEGNIDELPLSRWKKQDNTTFELNANLAVGANGKFTSLSSNYIEGDYPGYAPSIANFDIATTKALAFGRLEIDVDIVGSTAENITGKTKSGAVLRAFFNKDGEDFVTEDVIADVDGLFSIPIGFSLEEVANVTIISYKDYLFAYSISEVEEEGTLEIVVPNQLGFVTTKISPYPEIIGRRDDNWSIIISDNRNESSGWKLSAKMLSPLSSGNSNPNLNNGLIFVNENSDVINFYIDEPVLIYDNTNEQVLGETTINWNNDKGILANVLPGTAFVDTNYTCKIEWILEDAP